MINRTWWSEWAERWELTSQAVLLEEWVAPSAPSRVGQRWKFRILGPDGVVMDEEMVTDGSYVPDPFDHALSWAVSNRLDEEDIDELLAALPAKAVVELVTADRLTF